MGVILVGHGIEAVEDVVENKSHLILYFINNGLCALAMLTEMGDYGGNSGRGGSTSMMSARGGDWLAKNSMESNDASRGGLVVFWG
ncbi:hypothetical protein Tco_1158357 [Tanacetum coccineum]